MKNITRALISVSDKSNLDDLIKYLSDESIEIISTGGTAKYIKENIGKVTEIDDYTGYPEILGGRVKTLNPAVHGGILANRSDEQHCKDMNENKISPIDLVVVNLYPFENTVAGEHKFSEAIEKIDVGGPTMIRAAAKNFNDVTVITDPSDYQSLISELKENNNHTSYEYRKNSAIKAFKRTQSYDSAICNWFDKDNNLSVNAKLDKKLRYGENPHQQAELYKEDSKGIVGAKQLQGKELSYNNLNDGDAAYKIAKEFTEPFACVVKHANPCGAAIGVNICDAFTKALNCDPISSFGGIVALNRDIDKNTAKELAKIFFEVIITTGIDEEAKEILAKKKNLRVLVIENFFQDLNSRKIKSISGGLLVQDEDFKDTKTEDLNFVTNTKPTDVQISELIFANKIIKHVKSNAIIFTHNKAAIAIGAGQMSRVDAAQIASEKLLKYKQKEKIDNNNLVMASDAFFPFADGLEIGIRAGITAVIQPGGSIKDDEVIAKANEYNIAMAVTGSRHFSH
ncbi:MAG: bifunctional phosphoribosylaminoimidazolecarboxamide formyltransferase/IMP cyclohydrolase [Rickettsiales bacterium]|jgi:phosphoribosylaminoimidazolecarboxamide formyltransferase / IMP cyclohydrolase|nr:bifunctional phosphoribosylaminoimidazolecarboxamide formyltransferase/IMP cyclohydrolase [Rickettsiales bacterium]